METEEKLYLFEKRLFYHHNQRRMLKLRREQGAKYHMLKFNRVKPFDRRTEWYNGRTVERWNGGTVEGWNGGTVERWNGGVERWNGGTVERWNGGMVEW